MFGYVIPDKQNMYIKDFNVFQAFYCGLCKTLGETGSQITRLCTNYDVTFYNVLIHSLANLDVKFERKLCAYNGKKRWLCPPMNCPKNGGYRRHACLLQRRRRRCRRQKSRILIKWTLALRKKKAAKRLPEIDKMMKKSFSSLNALEKQKCDSIDRVADTFATLMRDITRSLIQTDDTIDTFTYNLGRLVYLLDAVDDVEKDQKKTGTIRCCSITANVQISKIILSKTQMNCRFCSNRLIIRWLVATTP